MKGWRGRKQDWDSPERGRRTDDDRDGGSRRGRGGRSVRQDQDWYGPDSPDDRYSEDGYRYEPEGYPGEYPGYGDYRGPAYERPGYEQAGYRGRGSRDQRYEEPRYDEPRYDEQRYDEPRYDEPRYDEQRYDEQRYGGQQGYRDAARPQQGYREPERYGYEQGYGGGPADAYEGGRSDAARSDGARGYQANGYSADPGRPQSAAPKRETYETGGTSSIWEPASSRREAEPASAASAAAASAASAANGAASRPYGRISIFTLLDDKVADFDRLAEETAEAVRLAEPDTLVYVIHLVPKAPLQRIFYEIYRDRAAFELHEIQSHNQRFESERRAYVLATNVIELRLKYAKVAPLSGGKSQSAGQELPSQSPRPSAQAPRQSPQAPAWGQPSYPGQRYGGN